MLVRQAKDAAHQWVNEEASKVPGFCGAFFIGSFSRMPDDTPFPSTSDVDLHIVIEDTHPPMNRMFRYQNIIFEVSYSSCDRFQSADAILASYPFVIHFSIPNVISDSSGELTKIQTAVARDFARRKWVHKRCEHAKDWLLTVLKWVDKSDPFHDQVALAWLYPSIFLTHIVLVADLQNPTFRKCFIASRAVLTRYGHLSLYESMLGILGSTQMSREQVEHSLAACIEVFDIAQKATKTPFAGYSAISDDARPIAIDGSREMIESGDHREAMLWIAVNHTWCQKVLHNDAPADIQDKFMPGYQRLLGDLGVTSLTDIQQRHERIKELLPQVWEVTEAIIAANPEIYDGNS